jgi:hypothetical protein
MMEATWITISEEWRFKSQCPEWHVQLLVEEPIQNESCATERRGIKLDSLSGLPKDDVQCLNRVLQTSLRWTTERKRTRGDPLFTVDIAFFAAQRAGFPNAQGIKQSPKVDTLGVLERGERWRALAV